ncbi:MAG: DUF4267 domain-containing protein [Alphaproteobacteria bacterium]|nr:DUF4267 domain-containing protein [Alphaproteobacteria bacterium]
MTAMPAFSNLSISNRIGLGMAGLMALFMALNTVRALIQPEGFAGYLGAPLADPRDIGFVHVYAFRAAFLALLAGALVMRRDIATLRIVALAALVMPLGDAWVSWRLDAPTATVARHLVIAAFLVATWVVLGLRPKTGG